MTMKGWPVVRCHVVLSACSRHESFGLILRGREPPRKFEGR